MEDLIAERDRLKQAVNSWMMTEAQSARFRFNDQAPMWANYLAAEDAVEKAQAQTADAQV